MNVVFAADPLQVALLYCRSVYLQDVPVETGSVDWTVYALLLLAKSEAGLHGNEGLRTVPAASVTANR